MVAAIWQDLRYGVRTLARNPAFAAVGLLVLALGIGVNTAIFSIVNAVLFRPLPVHAPAELLFIYAANPRVLYLGYRDLMYLKEDNGAFVDLLARAGWQGRVSTGGESELTAGEIVSANYFDVLGVKPALGRTFAPDDDRASVPQPVTVISHDLWRHRFDSDPGVLGRIIEIDHQPFVIAGVMGPEFKGVSNPWQPTQYWIPIAPWVANNVMARLYQLTPDSIPVYGIGRLKPGVTVALARAVVATKSRQLQQAYHAKDANFSLLLRESRRITLPFDPTGKLVPERLAAALMAVTGIVLLIAAANLAGILMARGVTRRGEIAIRLAFGAGRLRLIRQLLAESIVLAMLGGALGVLLARLLVHLMLTNTPAQFGLRQVSLDVPLDMRVLLFTALACMGAGLLVGLAPAVQASRIDLLSSLCGGGGVVPRQPRARVRHWIMVPQVCLSLLLLLVAGVFVRTLLRAELLDVGYKPGQVVFVELNLPVPVILRQQPKAAEAREQYAAAGKEFTERRTALNRRLLEAVKSLPDFSAAGVTDSLPLSPMHTYVLSRDDVSAGNQPRWIAQATVSPGYFEALGIPLLRGRYFDDRDTTPGPRGTVIVCQTLARQLWPDKNPVGEYLAFTWPGSPPPTQWLQVVGVVKEVKPILSEGGPNPLVYAPFKPEAHARFLVGRGYGSPAQLIQTLTKAVSHADETVEISRSRTMTDAIGEILYPRRMAAAILAVSGLIGLFLASVGIYGVVSYSVARRIREIGIRAALGAQRSDIMRLVIGEGIRVALIGSALGVVLAFAGTRLAAHFVVAIPAMDAITFVSVPLLLVAVILVACYLPARRAARVDPMTALREL